MSIPGYTYIKHLIMGDHLPVKKTSMNNNKYKAIRGGENYIRMGALEFSFFLSEMIELGAQ